jgi:hypothetical protein
VIVFAALKEAEPLLRAIGKRDLFDEILVAVFAAASAGLLVAIIGEFFGSETLSVVRGELVVTRGIGPVRRTFRYRVGGIAGLTSHDLADDDGGGYRGARGYGSQAGPKGGGKRHIHFIFFRPKSGTVRFEYGRETIYLADWLDEKEGLHVVKWLTTRLPRGAAEVTDRGGAANFR